MADTPDCAYTAARSTIAKVVVSVLYRGASTTAVSEYMIGRAPAPFVPADATHIGSVSGLRPCQVSRALGELEMREVVRRSSRVLDGDAVEGFELHRRRANESPVPKDSFSNPTSKNRHPPHLRLTSQEIMKHKAIAEGIARDWRGAAARVGIPFDDVQQTALLWLVRAAETYDPNLGTFPDYAKRWVKQGVRRLLPRAGAVTTARAASVADHARGAECVAVDPELAEAMDTTDADLSEALLCLSKRDRWLLRENMGIGRRARRATPEPADLGGWGGYAFRRWRGSKRAGKKIKARTHWSWARTARELAAAVQALIAVLRPLDTASREHVRRPAPSPNPLPSHQGGGIGHGGPTAGRAHARKKSQKP